MSLPLEVHVDALDVAAGELARIAAAVAGVGAQLEAATLSPPRVSDLPATAVLTQAHYDWTQTRFEDLTASTEGLDHLAEALRAAAVLFRAHDEGGAAELVAAATAGRF